MRGELKAIKVHMYCREREDVMVKIIIVVLLYTFGLLSKDWLHIADFGGECLTSKPC